MTVRFPHKRFWSHVGPWAIVRVSALTSRQVPQVCAFVSFSQGAWIFGAGSFSGRCVLRKLTFARVVHSHHILHVGRRLCEPSNFGFLIAGECAGYSASDRPHPGRRSLLGTPSRVAHPSGHPQPHPRIARYAGHADFSTYLSGPSVGLGFPPRWLPFQVKRRSLVLSLVVFADGAFGNS